MAPAKPVNNKTMDSASVSSSWLERVAEEANGTVSTRLPYPLRFLSSRLFWWKVLYAVRAAGIATLIPAALIAAPATKIAFFSTAFATIAAMFASRETFGAAFHTFHEYFKCCFVAFPLCTLYIGVHLAANAYAWSVVYMATIIFVFYCYDGLAKRIVLLLVNAMMVAQLLAHNNGLGPGEKLTFPVRLMAEFMIGCLSGFISMMIPFPALAFRRVNKKLIHASNHLSICFAGLCDTFLEENETQRRVNIVHIRYALSRAVADMESIRINFFVSKYEPQTMNGYYLRSSRVQLIGQLLGIVESSIGILEAYVKSGGGGGGAAAFAAVGGSPQQQQQQEALLRRRKELLKPCLAELADAVEAALGFMSSADRSDIVLEENKKNSDAATVTALLNRLSAAAISIEHATAQVGALAATMATTADTMAFSPNTATSTSVALATIDVPSRTSFFVFSLLEFTKVVAKFPTAAEAHRKGKSFWRGAWEELYRPFADTLWSGAELIAVFCPSLFPSVGADEARFAFGKLLASIKFAIAMGASMLFYYYTDRRMAFISGPQVLCFVMSATGAEAFHGATQRLLGTLLGTAVGYYFAVHTYTPEGKVGALCGAMFFFSFFRTGKQWGGAAMYAGVIIISMLGPSMTSVEAITKVVQMTWAVIFYVVVMYVIYPPRPSSELLSSRVRSVKVVADGMAVILSEMGNLSTSLGLRSASSVDAANKNVDGTGVLLATKSTSSLHSNKANNLHKNTPDNHDHDHDEVREDCESEMVFVGEETFPRPADSTNNNTVSATQPSAPPHDCGGDDDPTDHSAMHAAARLAADYLPNYTAVAVGDLSNASAAVRALSGLIAKSNAWLLIADTDPCITRLDHPTAVGVEYQQIMVRIRSAMQLMVGSLKACGSVDAAVSVCDGGDAQQQQQPIAGVNPLIPMLMGEMSCCYNTMASFDSAAAAGAGSSSASGGVTDAINRLNAISEILSRKLDYEATRAGAARHSASTATAAASDDDDNQNHNDHDDAPAATHPLVHQPLLIRTEMQRLISAVTDLRQHALAMNVVKSRALGNVARLEGRVKALLAASATSAGGTVHHQQQKDDDGSIIVRAELLNALLLRHAVKEEEEKNDSARIDANNGEQQQQRHRYSTIPIGEWSPAIIEALAADLAQLVAAEEKENTNNSSSSTSSSSSSYSLLSHPQMEAIHSLAYAFILLSYSMSELATIVERLELQSNTALLE